MTISMTISIPSGLCLINTIEYNKTLEENIKLKSELKDENKVLIEKIKILEERI